MSGYVASARIVRATPRLARAGPASDSATWMPVAAEPAEVPIVEAFDATDHGPGLIEHWAAFRERWSQLTFFLFDSASWRR